MWRPSTRCRTTGTKPVCRPRARRPGWSWPGLGLLEHAATISPIPAAAMALVIHFLIVMLPLRHRPGVPAAICAAPEATARDEMSVPIPDYAPRPAWVQRSRQPLPRASASDRTVPWRSSPGISAAAYGALPQFARRPHRIPGTSRIRPSIRTDDAAPRPDRLPLTLPWQAAARSGVVPGGALPDLTYRGRATARGGFGAQRQRRKRGWPGARNRFRGRRRGSGLGWARGGTGR